MSRTLLSPAPLVELKQAGFKFGARTVLDNLNLSIHDGQVWQLLGPAGSGKSLLLELLSGMHRLSSGTRSYPAFVEESPDAAIGLPPRFAVRLVSQQEQRRISATLSSFYQARWHDTWTSPLTVLDFLAPERVFGLHAYECLEALPMRKDFDLERDRCLAELKFGNHIHQWVGQLSNGELKKLLLIAAHLASPRLLLLDDPLSGLDPLARRLGQLAIERWCAEGQTLVYSSCYENDLAVVTTHRLQLAPTNCQTRIDDSRRTGGSEVVAAAEHHATRAEAIAATRATRDDDSPLAPLPPARDGERGLPAAVGEPTPGTAPLTAHVRGQQTEPPSARGAIVSCRNLRVVAAGITLLEGLDWDVHPGEQWILTGPNGAGKSTLLALLIGDHPQAYSNDILVLGTRLGESATLWERRRAVGFVAPELSWHYPLGWRLLDVVLSGFDAGIGVHRQSTNSELEIACRWLERFGLDASGNPPLAAVSEGEKRLALLARALVRDPRLLLLDEPTQNMGPAERLRLFRALDALLDAGRTTLVLVSHHPEERPRGITHQLTLAEGRLRYRGPVGAASQFPNGSAL